MCACVVVLPGTTETVRAAPPPLLVNYQGVLRDAADAPLDGPFDMVFRFWDAPEAGNEILVNTPPPVVVSRGVFNVMLGSGTLADGGGPGTYTALADVFRDYSEVFLSVQVSGEVLAPRVHVVSAAYALNANALDGRPREFFVDVGGDSQTKTGTLTCTASDATASLAVYLGDQFAAGRFISGSSADTTLGWAGFGIDAAGSVAGGRFSDKDGNSTAHLATDFRGIEAYGSGAGAYLANTGGGGYAFIGQSDCGVRAAGSASGGVFTNSTSSSSVTLAEPTWGIAASGSAGGGRFLAIGGSGTARLGTGDYGIYAEGNTAGGWFNTVIVQGITTTNVLDITGGTDIAERFPVRGTPEPGSVLVIDETRPGGLVASGRAYDARVAGIVAGAGDLRPGLVLRNDAEPDGVPVALGGRVWCRATTRNGPIHPGDLLVTSDEPGRAMRGDPALAAGTVLGKAMSALDEGEGLVLVLVHLR